MMSETDTIKDRLQEMECKFAFQQETIETLNAEVTKQWQVIDALRNKLEQMTEQILTIEDSVVDNRKEPPPPHY